MNRILQPNRYQQSASKGKFALKGVVVARLLVAVFLLLNIILIYTTLFSSNGIPGYRKQNQQVKELEEKVLLLRIENQKLYEMIQSLKTSAKAQEKLVRQELGWVRENEVILESSDKESEGAEKPAGPIKPFNLPR